MVPAGPAALERLGIRLVVGLFPVLAQRVTLETLPQQDAPQVGVVGKPHTHQIPGLSLLKLGARPDRDQRRHDRIAASARALNTNGPPPRSVE